MLHKSPAERLVPLLAAVIMPATAALAHAHLEPDLTAAVRAGDIARVGGEGDDMLKGGRGDDTFAFGPEPNGENVIRDFSDGRGEQDVIELESDFSFDSLVLTASGDDVVITGSGEAGSIHVTLENYLVDHEMSDLGSDDFLFS